MPKFRFDLPINAKRAIVDDVVNDAKSFGGVSNTTPWLHIMGTNNNIADQFIYQVVIDNLKQEDASYLILKHNLTLVRQELYCD